MKLKELLASKLKAPVAEAALRPDLYDLGVPCFQKIFDISRREVLTTFP